jgi:SRSO17 transposase
MCDNVSMNAQELRQCRHRLERFLADLLELVGRSERRHWGSVYVRGLILEGERKSIEPMARRMPDGDVQAMQQFIGQSPWDFRPVRRRLAERMAKEIVPACAWIVDDTGFPKQGRHSVGVARQYSGTLGKVGNCQVAVSIHLATDEASVPLDFRLYLPRSWTDDPDRMKKVGVPEGTVFKTKWELALELIDDLCLWDVPQGVVVSDTGYGRINEFRHELIERGLEYLTEVEAKTVVFTQREPIEPVPRKRGRPKKAKRKKISIRELACGLPDWKFKTIRWREGSKKKLASRFAAIRVDPAHEDPHKKIPLPPRQWLLIEWPKDEKEPTKYWFSNLPAQAGLRRLVRLAKMRWRVEHNYRQQKQELGLDHYEGRGFLGWHHHVTMNMIAYGFLLLEMLRHKKNSWLDPAEDQEDDSDYHSDLDRPVSSMR